MSIELRLNELLKAAMRAKDQPTLDVVRMIRSRIIEAKTAKGFQGDVDDALYQQVIAAYVKSLEKSKVDYAAAGDRGAEMIAAIQFEIDFLVPFLPKKLDEAATRALVKAKLAELDVSDPKQAGRVMGALMKDHKDELDAGLLKQILSEQLAG